MRLQDPNIASDRERQSRGFTLAEFVIATAVMALIFSGIILAYTQACYRAQWTGYSLAAEAIGVKQIEQARSAIWDPAASTNQVYQTTLLSSSISSGVLTGYTWTNLDLPTTGTNYARATNYVTIKNIPLSAGVTNIMIKVDTVWKFNWRNTTRLYTNTISTYLAPDNKDSADLFGS